VQYTVLSGSGLELDELSNCEPFTLHHEIRCVCVCMCVCACMCVCGVCVCGVCVCGACVCGACVCGVCVCVCV